MIVTLTQEEMLAQWKLRRYLEPLRDDCSAVRADGIGLDRYLTVEMRRWYVDMMSTATVQFTGWTDIADDVALRLLPDGSGEITLPANCLRVVDVTLDGWQRPATVITDPESAVALRQLSRFTRGGSVRPVAVVNGPALRLYTPPPGRRPAILSLRCVILPDEGKFIMDERALGLITPLPAR